ncbi:FAD-dependent oxidoreductase [Micrococcus porci]|uniref:oxidoreductase n=1 Tax=Micrococcus porci TaxID=2856555 RepID=UPI003CECE2B3
MTHMTDAPASHLLLEPLTVRRTVLRNRVVMGSMHLGLEDSHADLPALAAFYAERAAGGVGLIVTGGVGVTPEGAVSPGGGLLADAADAAAHRTLTDAVHSEGGRILVQLLHAGRYARGADLVSASATRAPISRHTAHALTEAEIEELVAAYARSARLALEAGYDGVEVMASEGYLLNQFLAPSTNLREDRYGGSAENRRRFPVAVVAAVREALGETGLLSVRTSLTDLVPGGQTSAEALDTARAFEAAGADLIMTGIGWHESRIPTVVTSVPRAAWAEASARVRAAVGIPVIAANRLTTPDDAEALLRGGAADLVAVARPLLADPDWVRTVGQAGAEHLTPCIACNQACLDHVMAGRPVSCLMNPRAGRETDPRYARPVPVEIGRRRRVAVVGAGPAGLTAAHRAAGFGHDVTLFEATEEVGGQFRLARRIPGKEEFEPALRHLEARAVAAGVHLRRETRVTPRTLLTEDGRPAFDRVIIATGVRPRDVDLPGAGEPGAPAVHRYDDVVAGRVRCGAAVAVIGAGGVGVDVAELLASPEGGAAWGEPEPLEHWRARWGVADDDPTAPGGLTRPEPAEPARRVFLLQRSPEPVGSRLRPTTGWVHRLELRALGVEMLSGVSYERVDRDGLHVTAPAVGGDGDAGRRPLVLPVTDVVVCAGQESEDGLAGDLLAAGWDPEAVTVIAGARVAAEVDAYRAMDDAVLAVQD